MGKPERRPRAGIRRIATAGFLLLAVPAAWACGGQSLTHVDDNGGGGAPEGGSSGAPRGGSMSGGTNARGGAGGTSGTGTAGTKVAGTSSGGGPTGGTGGGSTGGAAGICTLPIDSGPCLAYAPSFGFSAADGNCQPFAYGGCEGNANRFATLAECEEAQCGGVALSRCPPTVPSTAQGGCATGASLLCTYDEVGCLCAATRAQCNRIDLECGNVQAVPPSGAAPPPDGGDVHRIICRPYTHCTCGPVTSDAPASWTCQPGCGPAS